MPYTSPGDAFSTRLEEYMVQQAQLQRQAQLDADARAHAAQAAAAQQEELQQGRERLAIERQRATVALNDKEYEQTQKIIAGMVPGDILDPETTRRALKHGIPVRTGVQPVAPGMEPQGPDLPAAPRVYMGNRADINAENTRKRMHAIADQMEKGSSEQMGLRYYADSITAENPSGTNAPAGMFPKKSAATGHTRFIFDPVTKTYTDPTGKKVTELPPDAVVDRSAEPRDTSAHDMQRDAHLQTAKEHAYTEFNTDAKPFNDRIDRTNKLVENLNQKTNISDSTLAEQFVTLTAGGAGSGVRISQPMIDQVLKRSRTSWQDLDVALRRWSTASPGQARETSVFFTDEQRAAMRALAVAYRQEANRQHAKIVSARHQIDSAKDIDSVNSIRTTAMEDLAQQPDIEPEIPKVITPDAVKAAIAAARGVKQ